MKFYGIYVSKNKEILRNQIIESGICPMTELIKGAKQEEAYIRMLNGIEGKQVFLFSFLQDELMRDTPFSKLLSSDKYNFDSPMSIFKCYAIGTVIKVNSEDSSIVIDWEKNYQPTVWYRNVLSEPLIVFDSDDSKHEQLHNIIFKNQEMDYHWWAVNGSWTDKLKGKYHYLFNEDMRVFKHVYELPKAAIQWFIEHKNLNYEQIKILINSTDTDTTALVKLKSDFETLSEDHQSKYISGPIKDSDGVEFYVTSQWGRKGASSVRWDSFIHSCVAGGLEIKEITSAMTNESGSKNEVKGSQMNTQALNRILYGPPGTGKTYNTVAEARTILGVSEVAEWQGKPIKSVENLKQAFPGQVEFVTFHQSFSYEDFVEGLRANSDDGKLSYDIEDGLFKRLSVEATFYKLKRDNQFRDVSFSELYDQLLILIKTQLQEGPYPLASKNEKSLSIRMVSDRETLHVFHEGSDVLHSVGRKRLKRLFEVFPDIETFEKMKNIQTEITEVIGGANATVYWAVLNKLLLHKQEMIKEGVSGSSSELNYTQKKQVLADLENPEWLKGKPHVLIIDEINRGNISRIFGELITLIEDSKRIGRDEVISVQLPYSKESFSVPDNLYIIGTMNTADRSLAVMDTALRRRFDFIEMMPSPVLLNKTYSKLSDDVKNDESWFENKDIDGDVKVDDVNIRRILVMMNKRIEALYDREHTIGHAFFMSLKKESTVRDLANIFKNKILPLLEEYFFDDWQKIRWVLGSSADRFYKKETPISGLFADKDAPKDQVKYIKEDVLKLDKTAFINIYQKTSLSGNESPGSDNE